MPRPSIPIGTHGKVWFEGLTAVTKFHDYDGVVRKVSASGKSKTAAEFALKEKIRDRQTPSDRALPVTRDTRVSELLEKWLERHKTTPMPSGEMRADSTIEYYEAPTARLSARIGELRLHEATTAVLELALSGEGSTVNQWRAERKTLRQAFAYAVRMGALPTNPVADTTSAPGSRQKARALTVDEVREVRTRIAEWQDASTSGPKRMPELAHIVDVLLGTGLRITDALTTTWDNVELDATPPTLTAYIQKSKEWMTFILPTFVVDALKEQRARGLPSDANLVFPTRNGTVMSRQNVSTRWREARDMKDESLSWVSPHNFRKTAATLVEREYGIDRASKQLGHSGVAVTERHYVERAKVAPDNRGALDQLAR